MEVDYSDAELEQGDHLMYNDDAQIGGGTDPIIAADDNMEKNGTDTGC
jgi:hypothetical protein